MDKEERKQWYEAKAKEKQQEWQEAIEVGDDKQADYLMQEFLNYTDAANKLSR